MTRRIETVRVIEGAAVGVALWSILFCFELLPGIANDTWGVILFAIAAMAANATRVRPALIAVLILAAAVVLVVTETSLSNVVASRWVREDPYPNSPLPAVIVLSATANPNNTMSADALDNLLVGIQLVRSEKARALVTTTITERFPRGSVSTQADQARIIALVGGQVAWFRTTPTESTRDEAMRSAELLMPLGVRQVAVVAAPMHTRRACSAFEAVGFAVTCVPALVRSPGAGAPGPWPADRLRVFGEWVYEVAATLKYRSAGWLKKDGVRAVPNR